MGLRGLASLLDSPRRQSSTTTITHLDVNRLGADLGAAVNYVVGSGGGTASSGASLVASGCAGPHIDYAMVAHAVQQAVLAAASHAQLPAVAERMEQGAEQPSSSSEATAELQPASPSSASPAAAATGSAEAAAGSQASAAASAIAAPGAAPVPPVGRLGPAEVTLVEAKGSADIQGLGATSCSNFSTVRSSACVFKGRWMYEAQLGSSGIMQVGAEGCGWERVHCMCNSRALERPCRAGSSLPRLVAALAACALLACGSRLCPTPCLHAALAHLCAAGLDHAVGPLQFGGGSGRQPRQARVMAELMLIVSSRLCAAYTMSCLNIKQCCFLLLENFDVVCHALAATPTTAGASSAGTCQTMRMASRCAQHHFVQCSI